jgi:hypothetical protein
MQWIEQCFEVDRAAVVLSNRSLRTNCTFMRFEYPAKRRLIAVSKCAWYPMRRRLLVFTHMVPIVANHRIQWFAVLMHITLQTKILSANCVELLLCRDAGRQEMHVRGSRPKGPLLARRCFFWLTGGWPETVLMRAAALSKGFWHRLARADLGLTLTDV